MADACAVYNAMDKAMATPIDPRKQRAIDTFDSTFVKSFIAGSMTALISVCLQSKLHVLWIPFYVFLAGAFSFFFSGFLDCVLKSKGFWRCIGEAMISLVSYCIGGVLPMVFGFLVEERGYRIGGLVVATRVANCFILGYWSDKGRRKIKIPFWVLWIIIMASTAILAFLADISQ